MCGIRKAFKYILINIIALLPGKEGLSENKKEMQAEFKAEVWGETGGAVGNICA